MDHTEIAALAYRLWEWAGKPNGMDLDIWLEAERRWRKFRRFTVEPGLDWNI